MQSDIRLGKIFGIEIYISYSWFLIFSLVTFTLAFGFFPREFPGHALGVNLAIGLFASVVFFGSLLLHELSHSLVANLNKIPIKKITLFIFGGMSQMSQEPSDPGSEMKMAIAGPTSSLLLAGLFFGIFKAMTSAGFPSAFYAAFSWLAEINFFLAVFNLAPGFPLDGGRVLRAGVWYFTDNRERATSVASRAGQLIAFALISIGLLFFLFGQIGGIWLMLIGWFLNQAAVTSFRQVAIEHSLADVNVKNIMTGEVHTVGSDISLDELINHYFLKYRFGRFPVVDGDAVLGVVTLHDVKEIPRAKWPSMTAGDIIEPAQDEMFINQNERATAALMKMVGSEIGHLMVRNDEGRLVGIVTKTDIIKLVQVKSELG